MLRQNVTIQSIFTSIDRIELSIPIEYLSTFIVKLTKHSDCEIIHTDEKLIFSFEVNGKRIQLWKFKIQDQGKSYELKEFINQHIFVKHARSGSVGQVKETDYRGKNGNIRKGAKGFRIYCKETDNGKVSRLELQLNRAYLRTKNINIDNLETLCPSQFNLFDHVDFLDDFSDKGLFNLARTVVRKRGHIADNSKNYRFRVNIQRHLVMRRIHGSVLHKHNCLAEQIDELKNFKKEKGISVNSKRYCKPLSTINDLIAKKLASAKDEIGNTVDAVAEDLVIANSKEQLSVLSASKAVVRQHNNVHNNWVNPLRRGLQIRVFMDSTNIDQRGPPLRSKS